MYRGGWSRLTSIAAVLLPSRSRRWAAVAAVVHAEMEEGDTVDEDRTLSARGESLLHIADYVVRSLHRDMTVAIEATFGRPAN